MFKEFNWEEYLLKKERMNSLTRQIRASRDPKVYRTIKNQEILVTATSDRDIAIERGWLSDWSTGHLRMFGMGGKCSHCGNEFWSRDGRNRICSDLCANESRLLAERVRKGKLRKVSSKTCAHCGETFTPARSDAKFCSGSCRVAAYRANSCECPD